ncbi:MAG: hypothetical protein ACK4NU_12950 [Brevundimonas sp.]
MTDAGRLRIVRGLHTAIYIVMSVACFVVLYAGISGRDGPWLLVALVLVAVETVVFVASGLKCPLTAIAVRYGARPDGAYDTFFPERCTRHTFRVFGPLIALGLVLNALRWFDLL